MIYFLEENHEYKKDSGEELTSVSHVMHRYSDTFNTEESAVISAIREHSEAIYTHAKTKFKWWDQQNIINESFSLLDEKAQQLVLANAQVLKIKWQNKGESSSEYGTYKHSDFEIEDMIRGYKTNPCDGLRYPVVGRQSGTNFDNSYVLPELLKEKRNFCLLEGMVCDEDKMICGQEDVIFFKYLGGRYCAYNMDYKTDAKIEYRGFFEKGPKKMHEEMAYFHACNYFKYCMKISIYGLFLENLGVKVEKNFIMHVPKDQEVTYIETPFYKKHAEFVVNNWSN